MEYGFEFVDVDVRDGGIALVTFKEPADDMHDFVGEGHPMHAELRDIWTRVGRDRTVRAVVARGPVGKFYVGPPLEMTAALIRENPYAARQMMQEGREILSNLINFPKPLVAAVSGPAIGMGVQIALLADFMVAHRDSIFQDTHVRVGLGTGDGGSALWPLLIGIAKARRLLLRGHPMSAQEAYELGLVTELADDPDEVVAAAIRIAEKLARIPANAFVSSKYALNSWFRLGELISSDFASGLEMATFHEPDFQDTVTDILGRQSGEGKDSK